MNLFGLRIGRTENRSVDLDVGRVYSSFFQFGSSQYSWQVSPAVLAGNITQDGEQSLIEHSRRLSRQSPILRSYKRCMTGGILTGDPERPCFDDDVPEVIAKAVGDLWLAVHDCDLERSALHRLIVDGDLLLLDDKTLVPADQFTATETGPEWNRVVTGWRIGKGARSRHSGLMYVGDREPGSTRAAPWQAGAIWPTAALVNIRVAAAHGLGALAKMSAVIEAASADRITASAGVRSGLQETGAENGIGTMNLSTIGIGSLPFLRAGEKITRPGAGPDKQSMDYESILETEASTALNLPLSELKSDYSTGSFSNLRMAWVDADREYERRRKWWHRHFRQPLLTALLTDWIADGKLTGVSPQVMAHLKRATWSGPHRSPPQPEKQYMAVSALAKVGLTVEEAEAQLNDT